jgi:hypothetical protein
MITSVVVNPTTIRSRPHRARDYFLASPPVGNNNFEVDKTTSRKLRIPYPEIKYGTTSKRKQTNQIKELLIIDSVNA